MSDTLEKITPYKDKKRRRMRMKKLSAVALVGRGANPEAHVTFAKSHNETVEKALPSPRGDESRSDFISRFVSNSEVRSEFDTQAQRVAVAIQKYNESRAEKAGDLVPALSGEAEGHQHGIDAYVDPNGKEYLIVRFADGHDHLIAPAEDGDGYVMSVNAGHTHEISDAVIAEILADARAEAEVVPGGAGVNEVGKQKETSMTDETKKAAEELTAEKEALVKQVAELTEKLELAEKQGEMSAAERRMMSGMSEDERARFMRMSPAQRREMMNKAEEEDPVVYKSADGVEFRKSEQKMADVAKRADEAEKKAADLEKARDQDALEKRADEVLKHTKGDLKTRAAMLKAAEEIGDEAVELLKSADAALAGAFTEVGTGASPVAKSAGEELKKMAQDLQKAHDITYEQAYAKAVATPEGGALALQEMKG